MAPLAPERYALQLTIGQGTHDKLRHAQALLGHQVPSGDVAEVLDRALDALILKLERHKFGRAGKPRPSRRSAGSARHVPAEVRRRVWERDQGRCTFVSEAGRRCPARDRLEFDHVDEVARGGRATVSKMRLRCRAHNQYGAECAFGAGFMEHRRREARRAAAESRSRAEARRQAEAHAREAAAAEARAQATAAAEQARENDVVPWLRALGFRADEARRAAARCETMPDASLEDRVRLALSHFRPRGRTHGPPAQDFSMAT